MNTNTTTTIKNILISASCLVLLFSAVIQAQDSSKSLAFKGNLPFYRITLFYPTTIYNDLWNIFNLNKSANSGDMNAQHELGIRYLTGQGVFADTVKSAYWIKKAADQKLPQACYNYGILLNNGWGLKWDPVEAYKNFLYAAEHDMPEAEFAVGIIYTDDLVVERNWDAAYLWIKKAAAAGSKPAKEVLPEIEKRTSKSIIKDTAISIAQIDETIKSKSIVDNTTKNSQNSRLMFLDFSQDTTAEITTENIWDEFAKVVKSINPEDTLLIKDAYPEDISDSLYQIIYQYGNYDSPEALTLLGRFFEKGIYVKKSAVEAIVCYLRAARLDSPFAPHLLWKMMKSKEHTRELKARIEKNDPEAKYAWSGLFAFGLDNQITRDDAFKFLQQAALQNHLPSMIEIGSCYYTGSLVARDKAKAMEKWKYAAAIGSNEAKIRTLITEVLNNEEIDLNVNDVFLIAKELEKKGSIMAQTAYALCFEKGLGTKTDEVKAAKYFRSAAQRGSRYAYDELKRLYASYK